MILFTKVVILFQIHIPLPPKIYPSLRVVLHVLFTKVVILFQIHIPLPPKIDPSVTMMQVEEKPDVTYSDVGGCKEQIDKLREVS